MPGVSEMKKSEDPPLAERLVSNYIAPGTRLRLPKLVRGEELSPDELRQQLEAGEIPPEQRDEMLTELARVGDDPQRRPWSPVLSHP